MTALSSSEFRPGGFDAVRHRQGIWRKRWEMAETPFCHVSKHVSQANTGTRRKLAFATNFFRTTNPTRTTDRFSSRSRYHDDKQTFMGLWKWDAQV